MPRTDIHRPSLLNPSDYEFHAAFYQGEDHTMMRVYREEHEQYEASIEAAGPDAIFDGNWKDRGTCDHCGAHFAHGCLFFHVPTGTYIHVGHICASETISLPSRAALVRRNAERARAAERERIRRQEAGKAWREANPEVVRYLNQVAGRRDEGLQIHGFLANQIRNLDQYGSLFDDTAARVLQWRDEDIRRAHEAALRPEPVEPSQSLPTGRRRITGEVVSARAQQGYGGGTEFKMLVVEADGNKVWGTVPGNLLREADLQELRGRQVTLTATVEASRDDEHFGFYKRPTGAEFAA